MPLNERDELKSYSLMTKPFFNFDNISQCNLGSTQRKVIEGLQSYKVNIASMIKDNQKFEADVILKP